MYWETGKCSCMYWETGNVCGWETGNGVVGRQGMM